MSTRADTARHGERMCRYGLVDMAWAFWVLTLRGLDERSHLPHALTVALAVIALVCVLKGAITALVGWALLYAAERAPRGHQGWEDDPPRPLGHDDGR